MEQKLVATDDRVAIIGDGKLGLLTAKVLALSGLRNTPTLIGRHARKLSLVDGECRTWNSVDNPMPLGSDQFDVVIEASGSQGGLQMAADLCRPLGTVVVKTTCAADDNVGAGMAAVSNTVVVKELRIVGSRCGPHAKALELLASGLDVGRLVEKEYPLARAADAMAHAAQRGALKVVLVMPADTDLPGIDSECQLCKRQPARI